MHIEIIIPTIPGRERYLRWSITSCLQQTDPSLTVLISSNGKSSAVRELVESFQDVRLRVVEPDQFLPMPLNWEFALAHSRADIVSVIGDDDALMPKCIETVRGILQDYPNFSCLTHFPAQYYWPDFPSHYQKDMCWSFNGTGAVSKITTKSRLSEVLTYQSHYATLPYLYHGFVHKKITDHVRSKYGTIFRRSCPDIFSDLMLAVSMDHFLSYSGVLTVGGQGASSNGANFVLNTELGKSFLRDLPEHMRSRYSNKCVAIEVFEYIQEVASSENISIHHLRWLRLLFSSYLEAMANPAFRNVILNDIDQLSRDYFPIFSRILAKMLISVSRVGVVGDFIRNILLARSRISIHRNYVNAAARFGSQNVWEVAVAMDAELQR